VTSRPGLLAVAAALAGSVAGCGGPWTSTQKTPGHDYVALGDSYSAAPGVEPVDDVECFRSRANYPHLVAEATGLDLVDVTCSGATTSAITGPQQTLAGTWRDAQITAVEPGTDLVTIGVGGNDLGFYTELTNTCIVLASRDRTGNPCQSADDSKPAGQSLAGRLIELEQREVDMIRRVEDRAPRARILVMGYPAIVPDHEQCPELPVASGDVAYLSQIVTGLNDALSTAARRTGAEFVDLYRATRGHDICGTTPWIAGVLPVKGVTSAWHPYPEEQRVAARLIQDALDQG
jgi:hypothetical protein